MVHAKVIALLIAAGATVNPQWLEDHEEGRKLRADHRIHAVLTGRMS
jgi:hypothetical protein